MDENHEKNRTKEELLNPWKASDYLEKWNANAYLKFFNMDENSAMLPLLHFQVANIIKIFNEHIGNTKLNRKQHSVLEFGGGPCLWASLLLAQYFDEIWFCDFAPSNLKCVHDWLDKQPNAFDWKPFFNYVLDIKQGHHNNEIEYETKLRSTLNNGKIFRCDVNGENSLFIDYSISNNDQEQFDMIYSCCCLESACSSYDIFRRTICRFSNILKSGGILIICSFRNATSYTFNDDTYTDLPLNEEIITTAFIDTGYLTKPICINLDFESDPIHKSTTDGFMITYGFKK